MNSYDYIISKQVQWAFNHGIDLIGSEGNRGAPAYTQELSQNLFEPLLLSVEQSFREGNGGEIEGSLDKPAKMQAVHSSSALGVNVFQYWEKNHKAPAIATACRFCAKGNDSSERIIFEEKFRTGIPNRIPPNIDVVIHNNRKSRFRYFAIECKFTEAYSHEGHSGLAQAYLADPSIWSDIPHLYDLAKTICPDDHLFSYLHAAQLIKHILGLKKACQSKDTFKLLCLWYDAPGMDGHIHREEVKRFSQIADADNVHFISLTYQELIISLAKEYRQEHPEYIKYLTQRYL